MLTRLFLGLAVGLEVYGGLLIYAFPSGSVDELGGVVWTCTGMIIGAIYAFTRRNE